MDQKCTLLWKSWYGDEQLQIDFPEPYQVTVAHMPEAPEMSDEAIRQAVTTPVGCDPLRTLGRGKKSVCILIDDLSRPTQGARLVPPILDELRAAGIRRDNIFFLAANGAHRPQTHQDLVKKLGPDIVHDFTVHNHSVFDNLVKVGTTRSGNEIFINRFLHEADMSVAVGSLTPHPQAGFGGGGKMILPGSCGIETIARSHRYSVLNPEYTPCRTGEIEGNALREEIDETAVAAGLAFVVNGICNARNQTAAVFAGHPIHAHRAGAQAARRMYATRVPYHNDVAVFNAYPKDTELVLALNSLNVWVDKNDPRRQVVRKGGTVVIVTAATEGVGYHELIGIGFRQFVRRDKHATFGAMLRDRNVVFLCPTVSESAFYLHYPRDVRLTRTWRETRAVIEEVAPENAQVCVFPNSAVQLDRDLI